MKQQRHREQEPRTYASSLSHYFHSRYCCLYGWKLETAGFPEGLPAGIPQCTKYILSIQTYYITLRMIQQQHISYTDCNTAVLLYCRYTTTAVVVVRGTSYMVYIKKEAIVVLLCCCIIEGLTTRRNAATRTL